MRKKACAAAIVLLGSALGLSAGTLDEALERLARAHDRVRDYTAKSTGQMNAIIPSLNLPLRMTATTEAQVLREGGKQFLRASASVSNELLAPGAPPAKMEMTQLVVLDGQFLWMELRTPAFPQPLVIKMPAAALDGLQGGVKSIGGLDPGMKGDLREEFAQLKQISDLTLLGPGSVGGRATTRIEAAFKPEFLQQLQQRLPEVMRAAIAVRLQHDFDDATGIPLATKGFNANGEQTMTTTVTGIQVNTGLDKALFSYTPPPDANVQDATSGLPLGPLLPGLPEPE